MSTTSQQLQSAGENPAEYDDDDDMEFVEPVRDASLMKKSCKDKSPSHDSSSSWGSEELEISQAMGSLRESPATFRRPSKNIESNCTLPTRKSSSTGGGSSPLTSQAKQIQRRRSKAMAEQGEDATNSTSQSQSMHRRRTRSKDPQLQKGDLSPTRSRRSSSRDATSHGQRSSSRDLAMDNSSRRTRPAATPLSSSATSPRRPRSFAKSARTGSRSIVDDDGISPPSLHNTTVSQRSSRTLSSRPMPSRVKSKAALLTETPDSSTASRPRRSHSTDAESTRRHRSRSRSKDPSSSRTTHRSRSRDASSKATDSPGRLKIRLSKSSTIKGHSSSMHSHGDVLELSPEPNHSSLASHLKHQQEKEEQQRHHSSSHHPHHHRKSNKTDDDDVSMASTIYSMEPSRRTVRSHAASESASEAASPNETRPRLRGRRPRPEKSASLPVTTATPSNQASPSKASSSRSFRRKIGSPTAKPKTLDESSNFDSRRPSHPSPLTTKDKSMRSPTQRTSPIPGEKSPATRSTKTRHHHKPSPSSHVEKPTSSMSMESASPMSPQTKLDLKAPLSESFTSVLSPLQSEIDFDKKQSSIFSTESGKPTSSRSNQSAFFSDHSSSVELATSSFVDFGDDSLFATTHISNNSRPNNSSPSPSTENQSLSGNDGDNDKLTFTSETLDAFADFDFPVIDDEAVSNSSLAEPDQSATMSLTNFHVDQPSPSHRTNNQVESKPLSTHDVMAPLPNHKPSVKPTTESSDFDDAFEIPTKPFSVRSKASFIPTDRATSTFDAFASFDMASHEHSSNNNHKPPSLDDLFAAAFEKDKNERARTLEDLFASQQPFRSDKAASVSDLYASVPNLSLGYDPSVCSSPAASSVADRALLKSPNHSHSRLGNHFRIRSWGNFAALLAEPSLSSGGTRDDHSDLTSLGSGDLSTTGTTSKPLRRGLKKSRSFGDVSHFMSRETTPAVRRGKKPTAATQMTHNHSFSDDIMAMPAAAAAATISAKEGEVCVIRASHTSHTTTAVEDDFELQHNTSDCNSDTGYQSHPEEQEYLQLCLPATVNTTPAMSAILFPQIGRAHV